MTSVTASRRRFSRWTLLDVAWVATLALYALAGIKEASFHGDEAMQIYMSNDYATAFIDKQPGQLTTSPPYNVDADQQLRILNGSLNRYAIGLSWHVAGLTTGDLPPSPGWDWGLSYERNVETGHRPSDRLLFVSRLSSALFLALSVGVMFAIGRRFGGRLAAYFISGLYALNPVVLLNGRRAMQEGSFLFFGLLTVLVAIIIAQRREAGRPVRRWWAGLVLAGALALASKHSGVVFVASAFGWIFIAEWLRPQRRELALSTGKLAVSGAGVLALFVALSPALWNNPVARLRDLIDVRRDLVDIQAAAHANGGMSLTERLEAIVMQPFIEPIMHFEVSSWSEAVEIVEEVDNFNGSPLGGIQFGNALGWPLTALAAAGIASLLTRRPRLSRPLSAGVLLWLGVTVLSLLANPLPWQRYYLPMIPIMSLAAGIALSSFIRLIVQKRK